MSNLKYTLIKPKKIKKDISKDIYYITEMNGINAIYVFENNNILMPIDNNSEYFLILRHETKTDKIIKCNENGLNTFKNYLLQYGWYIG